MNDDQQNAQINDDELEEEIIQEDSGAVAEPEGDKEAELKEALARAMADLQNYKRRSEEEKVGFLKFAYSKLLSSLLPVFDNLGRSVSHLPDELKENEWAKGVIHINSDLLKTLESLGIKKMETIGQKLDPNKHEALMAGPGEKDTIVEEFEPGYTMGEEVIKAAKVKVGDGS